MEQVGILETGFDIHIKNLYGNYFKIFHENFRYKAGTFLIIEIQSKVKVFVKFQKVVRVISVKGEENYKEQYENTFRKILRKCSKF